MKTLKLFLLPVLDSLEFGWRVIRYALIFVSAFFRQRASLGCEMDNSSGPSLESTVKGTVSWAHA
jgi:hypothetical protein